MSQEKVVLVTGGKGTAAFAIKELVEGAERRENEDWHFIGSEDADLRDLAATRRIFDKIRPTHVLHCAAMVGGVYFQKGQQLDIFRTNSAIDDNVLGTCVETGVQKVISFSSTAILPGLNTVMDETMIQDGLPHESTYGYGMSKRNIIAFNRLCYEQHGLNYTSVIPTNIFGANDKFHPRNSHVVAGLIAKTYKAKVNNTPLVVGGTGQAFRQFIYSKDLARIVVWMLREYDHVDPIIASEDIESEMTIEQLARMICKVMDFHGPIEFDGEDTGAIRRAATNARLMKYMPDFKFTPMEQALKEASDWYVENIDTVRK